MQAIGFGTLLWSAISGYKKHDLKMVPEGLGKDTKKNSKKRTALI